MSKTITIQNNILEHLKEKLDIPGLNFFKMFLPKEVAIVKEGEEKSNYPFLIIRPGKEVKNGVFKKRKFELLLGTEQTDDEKAQEEIFDIAEKIIETLENDEYYKRADRVEIPASITAVEFYKHFGYGFKKLGHIVDDEGIYRMEKYPKISENNVNPNQYNMRPYIDNEYHDYKEFVYKTKKDAYKKYVEECWGSWNEEDQRKYFESFINSVYNDAWIIQLNGKDIGFYNGATLEDGSYEIGNICIIPEYQGKGIGTQVLKDIMELHQEQDLHIQYFKQNPVGSLYKRLGFEPNGETEFHYQMIKSKLNNLKNADTKKL